MSLSVLTAKDAPPETWRGSKTLNPVKGKKYIYDFYVESSAIHTPSFQPNTPKEEQVPLFEQKEWQSTCSGVFDFRFQNYEEQLGIPMANFKYNISRFAVEEWSRQGNTTWSDLYTTTTPAELRVNGEIKANPMPHKIGTPAKTVAYESDAAFLPSGMGFRLNSNAYQCKNPTCNEYVFSPFGKQPPSSCPYCQTNTPPTLVAKQGQIYRIANYDQDPARPSNHYLKGVRIEEQAHRIGVMLPPENSTPGGSIQWQTPMPNWVIPAEGDPTQHKPVTTWRYLGEVKHKGKTLWKVEGMTTQSLPKARPIEDPQVTVQNWKFQSRIEALIDPADGMSVEVKVEDQSSWYDAVGYPRQGQKFQIVSHYYKINYRASRR